MKTELTTQDRRRAFKLTFFFLLFSLLVDLLSTTVMVGILGRLVAQDNQPWISLFVAAGLLALLIPVLVSLLLTHMTLYYCDLLKQRIAKLEDKQTSEKL